MGEPMGGIYAFSDWITNVTFAGINNSSIQDGWITRYNSATGSVRRGETYSLSVSVNSVNADFSYQYIAAYIDWNSDGDCGARSGELIPDVGEGYLLGQGAGHPATMSINITVPNDAVLGTTWLRVMLDGDTPGGEGDYGCYVGYGEIKDFPVEIQEALPVELTSFSGSAEQNNIKLNWQTATEINNHGFEIERLVVNEKWEKIGFIAGAGNSNSPKLYSFIDNTSAASTSLSYRLKQIDNDGKYSYSKEITVELNAIPTEFSLSQNYPNPFNPSTTIEFSLPKEADVILKVYNLLGQEVATLLSTQMKAGYHKVKFDASGISSGVYLYKIQSGDFSAVKKLILLK